jgi:pimeloyl-ACP methyl ester carboxylesterase
LLLILSACATPAERIDHEAAQHGFTRRIVQGSEFWHVVYLNKASRPGTTQHVYLEGDGIPWRRATEVAPDPTPRHPLMLKLMALDAAPSLYLGRPCYHGLATLPPCSARLWTHERYSARVVHSLAAALRRLLKEDPPTGIVFIGHSGGGTLAMLLAEHFENTQEVVTLAGNLDIEAWAALHGYTPLKESLNPAMRPALSQRIVQRHYVGALDQQVLSDLAQRFATIHPKAEILEIADTDRSCWQAVWLGILKDLAETLK